GLRASVIIHLPGLVLTKRISRIIQVIQKLGLVVRGIYGEGSEELGTIFQVSKQITQGKTEVDINADLKHVREPIIPKETLDREFIVQ
ncbi:ATP--guanido phosphotransferase, partial [Bacillus cereus]|nr:ATP--guanido phosphotransferase [Bacillus cereus]